VTSATGFDFGQFDPVILIFMSVLALSVLLYELKRHGEHAARLLMSGIAAAGVLSGLILLQLLMEPYIGGGAAFYPLAAPLAYLGLYSSFRYYTGSLSERQAGLLLTVSAALLGSMLGTFFPTTFTLVLLVALSFLDVVFIETNILGRTVGLQRISSLLSVTTLPISEFGVGLGDLLVYSILVTSSFIRGGAYVALATVALILLGVIATIRITKSRHTVAGLPIPILLGLAPTILTFALT